MSPFTVSSPSALVSALIFPLFSSGMDGGGFGGMNRMGGKTQSIILVFILNPDLDIF